jgi:integrase
MHKKHRTYYWAGAVDGKKKWIRLSDEYQQALYKYAEIEGKRHSNDHLISGAIARFRAEVLPENAEKTRKEREYQLQKLNAVYGHIELSALETPHVQQFLTIAKRKTAANRHIKLLSQVYRHAIIWGLCKTNPCTGVKYHREKPRDRYITDIEFEKLKKAAEPMYQALIQIAYITGMRRGDLLDLELKDITDEGIYNRQNKTGGRQLYQWSPELRKAVQQAKSARKTRNLRYLFTSQHGQQISITAFNSAFQRLRKRAGLDGTNLHFHDIRHKTATDAKRMKGIQYAQQLLGHESESMTTGYISPVDTVIVEPLQ